jgi:hypothetical protein
MSFMVLNGGFFFKLLGVTNASAAKTQDQFDYFHKSGVRNLPNGVTKSRIAVYDDKDENVSTLVIYNECFFQDNTYSENHF